jgi:hypothetical protein
LAFQEYLVAYNQVINVPTHDSDTKRREAVIEKTIAKLDGKILEMLNKLEWICWPDKQILTPF